jgi:hypothetical protein
MEIKEKALFLSLWGYWFRTEVPSGGNPGPVLQYRYVDIWEAVTFRASSAYKPNVS